MVEDEHNLCSLVKLNIVWMSRKYNIMYKHWCFSTKHFLNFDGLNPQTTTYLSISYLFIYLKFLPPVTHSASQTWSSNYWNQLTNRSTPTLWIRSDPVFSAPSVTGDRIRLCDIFTVFDSEAHSSFEVCLFEQKVIYSWHSVMPYAVPLYSFIETRTRTLWK